MSEALVMAAYTVCDSLEAALLWLEGLRVMPYTIRIRRSPFRAAKRDIQTSLMVHVCSSPHSRPAKCVQEMFRKGYDKKGCQYFGYRRMDVCSMPVRMSSSRAM